MPNYASAVDFEKYGTIYRPRGECAEAVSHLKYGDAYPLRGRIGEGGLFPPEPGRYHLYVSFACPYAHRTLIVRALKGLEDAVSVSVLDPLRDGRGWAFREGPLLTADTGGGGKAFLAEVYAESAKNPASPGAFKNGVYTGRVSVPVLFDKKLQTIVSNYYPAITIDLGEQFNLWAKNKTLSLYPENERAEIDALNEYIFHNINEGVYRSGFAETQAESDKAVREVFKALDELEARLSDGRAYLFGGGLRESDVRLWVSLARFDAVYNGHFKVNLRRLVDYPFLWSYARRLYAIPAFKSTTHFDHIKRHYYGTQLHVNPTGIVPLGPVLDWNLHDGNLKKLQFLEVYR